MGTLNQYAARIANMVGQPHNHELSERIKDMFKSTMSKYIRQSTEKYGMEDGLSLSFIASVDELDYETVRPSEYNIPHKEKIIGTVHKLPVPIRVKNDIPFIYVGSVNGDAYKYMVNVNEVKYQHSLFPPVTRPCYTLENGRIFIHRPKTDSEIISRKPITEIMIKAIWVNPDEVLSMFQDVDGQDLELPFPEDLIETCMLEILRVEFGIRQQDVAIKINQDNPNTNTSGRNTTAQ